MAYTSTELTFSFDDIFVAMALTLFPDESFASNEINVHATVHTKANDSPKQLKWTNIAFQLQLQVVPKR